MLDKAGEYWDPQTPGFGLRISGNGAKSYFVRKRGPTEIVRFGLDNAKFPVADLDEARDEARRLLKLIAGGGSPKGEEKKQREEQQRKRKNSFEAVADDFMREKLPDERSQDDVKRDIKKELIPIWGSLPITEISDEMVASYVKARAAKKWRGKPTKVRARNMLALIKRLFTWAIEQRAYGIKHNPAAIIRAKSLAGKATKGDRTLEDDELRALWRALDKMDGPYPTVYRLLLLSSVRLNEAAQAQRKELKHKDDIWLIPSERMKGRDGDARPHAVPLTPSIKKLFDDLPETTGAFLFSTTLGAKPVSMGSKVKKQLDKLMLEVLRKDDGEAVLRPWTNHDIRRTVRTRLSRLKISEEAREAVLGHARPGIKGVYDHHDFLEEKRDALEQWAAALKRIAEPRGDNVRRLRA